jgi:hypothetical protein
VGGAVADLDAFHWGGCTPDDDDYSRKSLSGLNGVLVIVSSPGSSDFPDSGVILGLVQTDVELRLRLAGIPVIPLEDLVAPSPKIVRPDISVSMEVQNQ